MWLEFRKKLESFKVFSAGDVQKMFPGMNTMNLVRWQRKGYLIKIVKGWYCFSDNASNENIPWLAANLIYQSSYISMETALSYYNLIPEAVNTTTSVSTRRTNHFQTPIGSFLYRTLKKSAFWFGQTLIGLSPDPDSRKLLIAEPEKAILDFFYINPHYHTEQEIEALRLDQSVLDSLDRTRLYGYLDRFENKALNERIFKMCKVHAII